MTKQVRRQLIVFVLVTLVSVTYGSFKYLGVGELLNPPYTIHADFASSGGIYPRADVDLLGTHVGTVSAVRAGSDGGTIVDLAIDQGIKIPERVLASIQAKSAIGEQYVELTPTSAAAAPLAAGSTIERAHTETPLPVEQLLADSYALADSLPASETAKALDELSQATSGLGPSLGRLLDSSDRLVGQSLAGEDSLISLIHSARTVLGTQLDVAPSTQVSLHQLAGFSTQIRQAQPDLTKLFAVGTTTSMQLNQLLIANQAALPGLLGHSLSLTHVVGERRPALRKTLAIFPWLLESSGSALRYCEDADPKTGKLIQSSCTYDKEGKPVWKAWLAQQLDQSSTGASGACIKGYEGTRHYLPDGTPVGGGPKEEPFQEPNVNARCTAPPNDPKTANVRGAQNVPESQYLGTGPTFSTYRPSRYQIAGDSGSPAPVGISGLTWLLLQPFAH